MKNFSYLIAGLFFCIISVNISAQRYTISGFIEDKSSGERLINANVYDLNSKKGTVTNDYGFFSLSLAPDSIRLSVSFVGYGTYLNDFVLNRDMNINVSLNPIITLSEVEISAKRQDDIVQSPQMSQIEIPIKQIQTLPVIFGEADVMKTLQLMPGVQSGNEGTSGLYVRGGGPDQNLILLDGVPVYNASHLFGFFSVFNPDAISNVRLITGGFPARYGGRLSSVLDIRMKEGNLRKFQGEGSIGNIASKFTLEGPIIKDKTSFIISGRRTYIDLLAAPIVSAINSAAGNDSKFRAGYYFYDLNAKINHKFSDKDRLFLSLYMGRDKAYSKSKNSYIYNDTVNHQNMNFELLWGNITGALRWNHVFSNKLFANTTLIYSNYIFDTSNEYEYLRHNKIESQFLFKYLSGIENTGVKIDFDYNPVPRHSIKYGVNYLYHTFKPGVTSYKAQDGASQISQSIGNKKIYANEFYLYAEDTWDISGLLRANIGAHYSGFYVREKYYDSFQPRVSMRALLNEKISLKTAYSQMNQYIHLLTNSNIGLPTDLWLPSTDGIKPQNSHQVAIGLAYNIDKSYDLTVEGFYKTMNNLIEYKEGASFFQLSENWESKIEVGRGYSYGAEVLLKKQMGQLTGWIGYTLSWSWREFDNINFGEPFPYKYDRRHDISIVAMYKLNDNVDFGMTWVYGTGNAVTLAVARYLAEHEVHYDSELYNSFYGNIEHYKGRNGYRMPAYHRLDLSANFHKQKEWGMRTWSIGVYNAYNRQNPFFLYFGYSNNSRVLKQVSLFPIIPSVRYSFKF